MSQPTTASPPSRSDLRSPRSRRPRRRQPPPGWLRRGAGACAVGLLGVAALASGFAVVAMPAGAATSTCDDVTAQIGADLAGIAPSKGEHLSNSQLQELQAKAKSIFDNAEASHPNCKNEIARFQAQLAAQARQKATIKGTPFLGPIGWAWNNVYYKVFSGNDIMMGLFGWALLLSPFILVFSLVWVMKGSKGAFHRPYVPPHLRTEQ